MIKDEEIIKYSQIIAHYASLRGQAESWKGNSRDDKKHAIRIQKRLKQWIGEFKATIGLNQENN